MTKPGPEGDLSRIIGQINGLQEQRAIGRQTEAQYNEAILDHWAALLALCNKTDVQSFLETEKKRLSTQLGYVGLKKTSSFSFRDPFTVYFLPLPTSDDTFANSRSFANIQPGEEHGALFLHVKQNSEGQSSFNLDLIIYSGDNSSSEIEKKFTDDLTWDLRLDSTTKWRNDYQGRGSMKGGGYNCKFSQLHKMLQPEDFIRHPEWLEALDTLLITKLDEVYAKARIPIAEQQRRIDQFSGTPVEQVAELLKAGTRYSEVDLRLVAQDGAETALESTPSLPRGVSEERVKTIVAEMITERLAALQTTPERQVIARPSHQIEETIRQLAHGDPVTESVMRRFVRRSRDPQKVTQALLDLAALIPGSSQVSAILKAVNTMFGPEETTR